MTKPSAHCHEGWRLDQWLEWIGKQHALSMDFTLERARTVAQRLNVLKPAPLVVTVGGTNGKGSVVRLLEAALVGRHISTGVVTSPHLFRFNERIRLQGQPLDDARIIAGLRAVEACRGDVTLTYYEYAILASLWLLQQAQVAVAILEVGLGGRLDTVNLVDAAVAVITSIGIDHVDVLGHDREAIGAEKAGIFRAKQIAVLGDTQPPASIAACARALGTKLHCAGADFYDDAAANRICIGTKTLTRRPAVLAEENVRTALAVLHYAFPKINLEAAYQAMQQAELPGRLWCHQGNIWLDVAHNPDAARHLVKTLSQRLSAHRLHCLYATLADKDATAFAFELQPWVHEWYLGATTGARACGAAELAQRLTPCRLPVRAIDENFSKLCETALSNKGDDEALLICGSFSCVEQAATYLNIAS